MLSKHLAKGPLAARCESRDVVHVFCSLRLSSFRFDLIIDCHDSTESSSTNIGLL